MKRVLVMMCLGVACARQPGTRTPAPAGNPIPATAPSTATATATIRDVVSTIIGSATFTDTPGGLLINGSVTGLGIGAHGLHLHAVGVCQTPLFTTAGPHFNPSGARHGFKNPAGSHAGDLPNLISPPAGIYKFHFVAAGVKLTGRDGLLDGDGASIVIHSNEDDYLTDPSGNSGSRFACGVITLAR